VRTQHCHRAFGNFRQVERISTEYVHRKENTSLSRKSDVPIRKNNIPPGPWVKSDTEEVELFANHLAELFTPHNSPDPEVEREIASHKQHKVKMQVFTLRELTLVFKLHPHRAPGSDLVTAQMLHEMTHKGYQSSVHF